MWRDTAIGRLFRIDPEQARAEIIRCAKRNDGNLYRMTHELGIHRSWLYRLIYRWDLWAEIDSAREAAKSAEPAPDNWLARTLAALEQQKKR